MLKKIQYIIATLGFVLLTMFATASVSAATAQSAVCDGIGLASTGNGCAEDPNSPSVDSTIHTVVTILSLLVGVISVIMIIVGGFRYVTSGGDSTKVGSAKNTITYAIVGLIIVALAQVIVRFTLNKTSGSANPASNACTPVEHQAGTC